MALHAFLLIAAMLVKASSGAQLNSSCTSNSVCSEVKNSNCKILAPTCGQGTCKCIPGFADVGGTCKRKVLLGFSCNSASDTCGDANAECVSSRCTCQQGYKQGLKGYDCISNLKSERYNAKCFDTVQCYYNMVCIENRCQCYPGFKQIGDYDCTERTVGDTCSADDDCSRVPNTACSNGVCDCTTGYKRVQYLNLDRSKSTICILQAQTLKNENEPCNITSAESPVICKSPFVCLACSSSKTVCTRPTMPFSGARRVEALISFVAVFASAILLFDC